ncbi:MAG: Ni/Fe hydrogenase subunit alpha [Chloroflexota bacterium]
MSREIVIDPVTRIEGHSKITIQLDDTGNVQDAHFHVTQLRGFEKFVEGRPFQEMPSLMARICGICPVSHLMASSKACDALMRVNIPRPAVHLRRIMNLAQIVQSHALSFFYLSSPDLLLGMDAPPEQRNLFGVAQANPQLALGGVQMRKFGQQIIEMLGGKRIHPGWVVPGGVSEPLSSDKRDAILKMIPDVLTIAQNTLTWYKQVFERYQEEIDSFANFPSLFLALVNDEETLEMYDGKLRFIDSEMNLVTEIAARDYESVIAEAVEPSSYLKSPYFKPLGYPDGIYRVGPLARLNIVQRCGTPLADEELVEFRKLDRNSSFHFHYARLIEILYSIEKIQQLLNEPDILDTRIRAHASPNRHHGIGVSEAPRGTLIHHYEINDDGLITRANLIIATGHNNLAMNRGVLQVAQRFITGLQITDGMLNRVEAVIRAFDPCLSCSTHAIGQMPLQIQLLAPDGAVIDEVKR